MKQYTHGQMVEMFGIGYHEGLKFTVDECFSGLSYGDSFPSVEALRDHLIKRVTKRRDEQHKTLNEIIERYESLPLWRRLIAFIFKRGWKKNILVREKREQIESEYEEYIVRFLKMSIRHLDENIIYTMTLPEIVEGQKLYISVTSQNNLDVGVYEGIVRDLEYHLKDKNTLIYSCELDMGEKGEDYRLREFNGKLHTWYTYHKPHLTKEEAVNEVKTALEDQRRKLEEQIRSVE